MILPRLGGRITTVDRISSKLAAVADLDLGAGLAAAGAEGFDLLDDVGAFGHLAEDDVLAVEP